MSSLPHVLGVEIKDELIVSLDLFSKDLGHIFIRFIAIRAQSGSDSPESTLWLARTLERKFSLHSLDYIFIFGQEITRFVGGDCGRRMCIDV